VIHLTKQTKPGGFWSFAGVSILCSIPFFVLMTIIATHFAAPVAVVNTVLVDIDTNEKKVIRWILAYIASIGTLFLAAYIYSKIRVITRGFAKKMALIFLIIQGLSTVYGIMRVLFFSGTWDLISLAFEIVGMPVMFLIVRKLLLQRATETGRV